MAELLVEFDELVTSPEGKGYVARVWGEEDDIGRWIGHIEFADPVTGESMWTDQETVQPNRRDLEYWVTGLSRVFLDGALVRAQHQSRRATNRPDTHTGSAGDADLANFVRFRSILDPFATYLQGEGVLRAELGALSTDQLRNVAAAFAILSPETSASRGAEEIRDEIVRAARQRMVAARERDLTA